MVGIIKNSESQKPDILNTGRLLTTFSTFFFFVVCLTIFQDYLHSRRNEYSFYFSESVLFKTFWLAFIPILMLLIKKLNNARSETFTKLAVIIIICIVVHLIVSPTIAVIFSKLFYQGRYDYNKFFSYTWANDFYKLVIVYTGFVIGCKYFQKLSSDDEPASSPTSKTIVINSGRDNVVVNTADILQITSSSPYVIIHLENKKHLHSESLKSISTQLDSNVFLRVHKSTIVNTSKVVAFKSRLNGDYDLHLTNGDCVRLSRTYAADFKKRHQRHSTG